MRRSTDVLAVVPIGLPVGSLSRSQTTWVWHMIECDSPRTLSIYGGSR